MTPAEAAVLAAARAYRDAHARCLEVGLDPPDGVEFDAAGEALLVAATLLGDDAPPLLPTDPAAERRVDALFAEKYAAETRTPLRPWPDPEAYRALALEVFGESGAPADVGPAVAAWKALQHGQRVVCARGYQWTADRTAGRLRFTMARQDGRPGKTLEQPWYPLIMARLPVWPIVIEVDADVVGSNGG